ncbi:MAG: hypothetical protein J0I07_11165 [Myxococcales bacterium]|nr:hypothetical protein [Myxococcales bacterium]
MSFPYADYILIGTDPSPGNVTITAPNSPRNWDERKGYGYSGASLVFTGNGLAVFDGVFRFWDEAHSVLWDAYATRHFMAPQLGLKGTSIGIYNPVLVKPPHKITQVVVTDVKGWTQVDDGLWETVVSFKEFRPPKPALVKPTPGIPAGTVPKPTIKDAQDAEIAAKLAELQKVMAP